MDVHPYIKLIEFALKDANFSIEQACSATKIGLTEFQKAQDQIFLMDEHLRESSRYPNMLLEWKLSPPALFGYIQYQAYRDAVESARKADKRAFWALIFAGSSVIIPLSGLLVSGIGALI